MDKVIVNAFAAAANYETIAYVIENENTFGYLSKVHGKPVFGVINAQGGECKNMTMKSLTVDEVSRLRVANQLDLEAYSVKAQLLLPSASIPIL